jgi:NADPH-dependent 2,4-dienoyl-CoA reductase/sulfur reductase-like enzyme
MAYEAKPSADGYTYTKKTGLVGGLRTYGVIQPEYRVRKTDHDIPWEAIVIGAGYAGLTAARDLVKAGRSN